MGFERNLGNKNFEIPLKSPNISLNIVEIFVLQLEIEWKFLCAAKCLLGQFVFNVMLVVLCMFS